MPDETLALRLKALRKRQGLSLEKVGDSVGVSTNSVYKWEHELAHPSAKNLSALADFFGVEPVFLAYGVTESRTPHDELIQMVRLLNDSEAALLLSLVNKMLSPRTDLEVVGE